MSSKIVGRDIDTSILWMLVIKHSPLWCNLPKDLVRLVLKQFLFNVETCWCGKMYNPKAQPNRLYNRSKWMPAGWFQLNCSLECYYACEELLYRSHFAPDQPELRHEDSMQCCYGCRGKLLKQYWVVGSHRYLYCVSCFKRYACNGLYLEK
jgi:hypothetical protein